jgi:hypothetical protein
VSVGFFHFFETTTFYSSRGPDFLVQDWNRTTKSGTTGQEFPSPERTKGVFNEYHYTVREVADLWNLSKDSVKRLFRHEPGVLVFTRSDSKSGKRRYETLLIPESVLERVHKRLELQ